MWNCCITSFVKKTFFSWLHIWKKEKAWTEFTIQHHHYWGFFSSECNKPRIQSVFKIFCVCVCACACVCLQQWRFKMAPVWMLVHYGFKVLLVLQTFLTHSLTLQHIPSPLHLPLPPTPPHLLPPPIYSLCCLKTSHWPISAQSVSAKDNMSAANPERRP